MGRDVVASVCSMTQHYEGQYYGLFLTFNKSLINLWNAAKALLLEKYIAPSVSIIEDTENQ